jgi:hypothetical protein
MLFWVWFSVILRCWVWFSVILRWIVHEIPSLSVFLCKKGALAPWVTLKLVLLLSKIPRVWCYMPNSYRRFRIPLSVCLLFLSWFHPWSGSYNRKRVQPLRGLSISLCWTLSALQSKARFCSLSRKCEVLYWGIFPWFALSGLHLHMRCQATPLGHLRQVCVDGQ